MHGVELVHHVLDDLGGGLHVVDAAQHLDRYRAVPADKLRAFALGELRAAGGEVDPAVASCFDLERYGRELLIQRGYAQTADGCAYIARQQAPIPAGLTIQ